MVRTYDDDLFKAFVYINISYKYERSKFLRTCVKAF